MNTAGNENMWKSGRTIGMVTLLVAGAISGVVQADEPELIELGDGRFQIALDSAVGTETPAWLDGAIEWEYAGQAVYVLAGSELQRAPKAGVGLNEDASSGFEIIEDDGPTDTMTRFLHSEMEDEYGRLFRVKNVDEEKFQAAIDAYNAKVEAEFGFEEEGCDCDADLDDAEPNAGDPYTPMTWYREDQDGDGSNDRFRWNSEGRGAVWAPLTSRQEKVVVYFFGDVGSTTNPLDAGHCTGTLIGDNWVLTAAHCCKNDAGTAWIYAEGSGESYRGKVCTNGNFYSGADCANVTARWGNGKYGGSGDMGDDLVVMKIDESLGSGNYMALSQASNGTIKDHANVNLGFPGNTPYGANDNTFGTNCSFSWGDPYAGMKADAFAPCESVMYWDADEATYTSTKVLGTRIDMSTGHSGGPIFYYPGTWGGSHYVTGVVSGHNNGTSDYNGGPKVPYHRDWIIGIMDAH